MSGGSLPPWMSDASARRAQNRRSSRQEARVARDLGGRAQPGSGSSRRAPGDVKTGDDLVECKYTDKDGFRLTAALWNDIRDKAQKQGREPKMIIELSKHGIVLEVTER